MGDMIVNAVAISSTSQMDDNEEPRGDSGNASSTIESEDNGNDAIVVEEDQEDDEDSTYNPVLVFKTCCHHHIRKVWLGDVVKHLSDVLRDYLSRCLEGIDSHLRIHPNMKNILRALDKCFSLPDNYPKRKGTYFKHWCVTYYPDYPFYPVEWTMGARNDMFSEGSVAAYTNTWLHKLFLEKLLSTIDVKNILQENLFTILSSVKMIAMSRPMSILHFYINVPMWWLMKKKHFVWSWLVCQVYGQGHWFFVRHHVEIGER